jgi:hypothetical protein
MTEGDWHEVSSVGISVWAGGVLVCKGEVSFKSELVVEFLGSSLIESSSERSLG